MCDRSLAILDYHINRTRHLLGTDEMEVAWSFIVKLIIVGENIYVPIDSVLGSYNLLFYF